AAAAAASTRAARASRAAVRVDGSTAERDQNDRERCASHVPSREVDTECFGLGLPRFAGPLASAPSERNLSMPRRWPKVKSRAEASKRTRVRKLDPSWGRPPNRSVGLVTLCEPTPLVLEDRVGAPGENLLVRADNLAALEALAPRLEGRVDF